MYVENVDDVKDIFKLENIPHNILIISTMKKGWSLMFFYVCFLQYYHMLNIMQCLRDSQYSF